MLNRKLHEERSRTSGEAEGLSKTMNTQCFILTLCCRESKAERLGMKAKELIDACLLLWPTTTTTKDKEDSGRLLHSGVRGSVGN